jgi:hypothetical protein
MIKKLIGKLSRYLSPSAADRLSRQIGAERSHAEADLLIDDIRSGFAGKGSAASQLTKRLRKLGVTDENDYHADFRFGDEDEDREDW